MIMILNFLTDMIGETVTPLCSPDQSDQGLQCLQLDPHLLEVLPYGKQTWGNCNSNCNVIVMNYIFEVMESNL